MSTRKEEHFETADVQGRFDFKMEQKAALVAEKGLNEETVRLISEDKGEPEWMLQRRLRALKLFHAMPMPSGWPGIPDLSEVDVNAIVPYIRPDVEVRVGRTPRRDSRHVRQTRYPGGRTKRALGRRRTVRVRNCLPEHA
jgi:Fe-S cluster assembly protein SufB